MAAPSFIVKGNTGASGATVANGANASWALEGAVSVGDTIVVTLRTNAAVDAYNSLTDNLGNTYTELLHRSSSLCGVTVFRTTVTTGGTPTFSAQNTSGASQTTHGSAVAYGPSAIDVTSIAATGSTASPATAAVVTTGPDRTAIGICASQFTPTSFAPAGGETERTETDRMQVQDETVPSAGSYQSMWTLGASGSNVVAVVVLKQPITIASVNGGADIEGNDTSVAIVGDGFGANETARDVFLVQGATEVEQVQATGTSTAIDFAVTGFATGGLLRYGAASAKVVVGVNDESVDVLLVPPAGFSYVTITSINPDPSQVIETDPPLAIGDQVEFDTEGGTAAILADGTPSVTDELVTSITLRVQDGTGWGAFGSIDIGTGDPIPPASGDPLVRMRASRRGMQFLN